MPEYEHDFKKKVDFVETETERVRKQGAAILRKLIRRIEK